MKHIIAHLIKGEAKTIHENITKDLTERFDVFPIHNLIQPHLTLKRWFELDTSEMENLYKTLDDFAISHKPTDYNLAGFGHFDTDVIYVDVIPSEELRSTLQELSEELHKIENLTFDEYDVIENDLHATVAMSAIKPFNYDQIWNYLQERPFLDLKMKFDNIAILKRDTDKWIIDRVWEIKP